MSAMRNWIWFGLVGAIACAGQKPQQPAWDQELWRKANQPIEHAEASPDDEAKKAETERIVRERRSRAAVAEEKRRAEDDGDSATLNALLERTRKECHAISCPPDPIVAAGTHCAAMPADFVAKVAAEDCYRKQQSGGNIERTGQSGYGRDAGDSGKR